MAILVGMDEAGYGPNFGPLVVAATAWEVADEGSGVRHGESSIRGHGSGPEKRVIHSGHSTAVLARPRKKAAATDEIDLYRLLRPLVSRTASERRLAIADSKILYKPGLGLRQLERGVLGALSALRHSLTTWSAIVEHCAADPEGHERQVPWHDGFHCTLPVDATTNELAKLGERMHRTCDGVDVRLRAIRARLVFPARFNDLIAHYGTKGAALSHVTVGLLREVLDILAAPSCPSADADSPDRSLRRTPERLAPFPSPSVPYAVTIVCDKHGGRNYYTALLQHHFSEHWIEPLRECRDESVYSWGPPEARVRASFRVGGESFLPTALASMTAKYLRELAMRAFNEYWCTRVADLRPTAGYPKDSHRFRKAIAAAQRELGIDDHVLWRCR
jgi:hypothetical protein